MSRPEARPAAPDDRDVQIDATLVMAGMTSGLDGVLAAGLRLGFATPDDVLERTEWLKEQPDAYVFRVAELAGEYHATTFHNPEATP